MNGSDGVEEVNSRNQSFVQVKSLSLFQLRLHDTKHVQDFQNERTNLPTPQNIDIPFDDAVHASPSPKQRLEKRNISKLILLLFPPYPGQNISPVSLLLVSIATQPQVSPTSEFHTAFRQASIDGFLLECQQLLFILKHNHVALSTANHLPPPWYSWGS